LEKFIRTGEAVTPLLSFCFIIQVLKKELDLLPVKKLAVQLSAIEPNGV